MLNFENLDKFIFPGVGKYGIPKLAPVFEYPVGEFIPVNEYYKAKDRAGKIVHFFVDDYRFVRHWNQPDRYIPALRQFKAVCAPDFSTYADMPMAMQIYNHYRKHWLAAYWQMLGLTVYPTISWSTPDSWEWCFDGDPGGGVVAVSSVGCARDADAKRLFLQGYEEMMKRLDPSWVIFYGHVFDACSGRIIQVRSFAESIRGRQGGTGRRGQ